MPSALAPPIVLISRERHMTRSPITRIVFSLLLSCSIVACTKSDSTSDSNASNAGASTIESHELLTTLPDTSVGFLIWDLDHASFKEFRSSPWGDSASSLWSGLGGEQGIASSADVIGSSLQKAEFWQALQNHVQAMAASTFFVPSKSVMGFFATMQTRSKEDTAALAELIRTELANELFSVSQDGEIYSAIHSGKDISIFYRLTENRMYVASQRAMLTTIPNGGPGTGVAHLTASPAFEKAVKQLPARDKEYSLVYLNAETLLEQLPSDVSNQLLVAKNIPFEGIAINRSMREGPLDSVAITFSKKAPEQVQFLHRFSQSANLTALQSLPKESAIGVGIDGGIISGLIADVKRNMPDMSQQSLPISTESIESVISFSLGFEDVAPGALFPSVMFSFVVAPGSNFATELKSSIATAMQANTGIAMPWQEKTIEDTPVQYLLTPLGIGVYIASSTTKVFVASSEQAVKKMLLANKAGDDFLESFPKSIRTISSDSTFAELVVSFPAVATTVRNLSGSLAMFTGGQTLYEEKHLESLESFGLLAASLGFSDDTLLIQNHYTQQPN